MQLCLLGWFHGSMVVTTHGIWRKCHIKMRDYDIRAGHVYLWYLFMHNFDECHKVTVDHYQLTLCHGGNFNKSLHLKTKVRVYRTDIAIMESSINHKLATLVNHRNHCSLPHATQLHRKYQHFRTSLSHFILTKVFTAVVHYGVCCCYWMLKSCIKS